MLRPCPECRREISTNASSCPHCGHPLHSSDTWFLTWLLVGLLIVAVVLGWLPLPK